VAIRRPHIFRGRDASMQTKEYQRPTGRHARRQEPEFKTVAPGHKWSRLPWRRRKEEAAARALEQQLEGAFKQHRQARHARRVRRRAWKGIHPLREQARLQSVGQSQIRRHLNPDDPYELPVYDDPQARKMARRARHVARGAEFRADFDHAVRAIERQGASS
jgi:hypothetical protein